MGKPVSFLDRYMALARERRSVLCVGLDLTDDHVPPRFRGDWMAYLRAIVDVAPMGGFFTPGDLTAGMAVPRRKMVEETPRPVSIGVIWDPVRSVHVSVLIECVVQPMEIVLVADHGLVDAGDTVALYRPVQSLAQACS